MQAQTNGYLSELGIYSWKVRNPNLQGQILSVKKSRGAPVLTVLPKKKDILNSRHINPETRYYPAATLVYPEKFYEWKGRPLNPTQKIKAAPFYSKDNSIHNVTYTDKAHGFIETGIACIAEDDRQYIWFSCPDKLIKFDGIYYWEYPMEDASSPTCLRRIKFVQELGLCISSEHGFFVFRNDSIFEPVFSGLKNSDIFVQDISLSPDGSIWISTLHSGAICLNTHQRYFQLDSVKGISLRSINSVLIDKNKDIWIAKSENGMIRISGKNVYSYFEPGKSLFNNKIVTFLENENGIWMGGFNSGLIHFSPDDTLNYSLYNTYSERIFNIETVPGGLWYAVYGDGVVRVHKDGNTHMNHLNGLSNRNSFDILYDSFGNLWVSDLFSGISRINENIIHKKYFDGFKLYDVRAVAQDHKYNTWYMSSGADLMYETENNFQTFSMKYGDRKQNLNYIHAGLVVQDNSLWAGAYGPGILHITPAYFDLYRFSEDEWNQIILTMDSVNSDELWYGTIENGLISQKVSSELFRHYTVKDKLRSNSIKSLLNIPGEGLWVNYDLGLQKIYNTKLFDLYLGDSIADLNFILLAKLHSGEIIAATQKYGLLIFKKNKIFKMGISEGLPDHQISSVVQDSSGVIWLTTYSGIVRFKLHENKFTEMQYYSGKYNLLMSSVNGFSCVQKNGNPMWALHSGGFIEFDSSFQAPVRNPVIQIRNIFKNSKDIGESQEVRIFPDTEIDIQYNLIFWGNEQMAEHKYIMINQHNEDTVVYSIPDAGSISLNGLYPGSYKFQLLIMHKGRKFYSSEYLMIHVYNFWYSSVWFYALIAVVLIVCVILYLNTRAKTILEQNILLEQKISARTSELILEKSELEKSNQQIQLQNQEKDALVHEIHHRVKNNLQYISAIINMQIHADPESDIHGILSDTTRRIDSMALVHELLYSYDNILMLSSADYITQLCNTLRQMTFSDALSVEFTTEVDDILIDANRAVALGMIMSEIISNSIKHAFAGIAEPRIGIQLVYDSENQSVRFRIDDNGTGYAPEAEIKSGMGRRLIDIFSRQLKAEYSFVPGEGVTFVMNFNYVTRYSRNSNC